MKGGILLPNGLMLKYPGLKYEKEGKNVLATAGGRILDDAANGCRSMVVS